MPHGAVQGLPHQALAETAIEAGQARFLQRVIAGEAPEAVAAEIDAEIGRQHGELVRQFGVPR